MSWLSFQFDDKLIRVHAVCNQEKVIIPFHSYGESRNPAFLFDQTYDCVLQDCRREVGTDLLFL